MPAKTPVIDNHGAKNTVLEPEMSGDLEADETPEIAQRLTRNTQAEVRELQRLMLDVARHDESGNARASAARAYKELEILRLAKLGKPLMLSVTAKADAPQRKEPLSPAIVLEPDHDVAQVA